MKPPSCLPKGLLCISTSDEWDFLLLHLHVGIWSCGFCFVFQFFGFEPLDFNRHAVVFHYFNLQLPNMDYIAIFSYAYVLCVYLLWWGICLHLMPILKWVILFFFLIAELEEFFVYFACKLSDTCFSNISSQCLTCLFIPLMKFYFKKPMVAQWYRIRLSMQETRVQLLIWKDFTCRGATKPMCHNHLACAPEPRGCNYWAHRP